MLKASEDDTENIFTEAELFDILNDIKRIMDHIEANAGGSVGKRVCLAASLL